MKSIRRSFAATTSLGSRVIVTIARPIIVFMLYEPGEAPYFKDAQRFFRRKGKYFVLDD